jgi:anthranilate/para-aminobenzoate synthase component I
VQSDAPRRSWSRSGDDNEDHAAAHRFLADLDAAAASLVGDQVLLFMWGYDAAVCLDRRLPRQPPHGVADACMWVCEASDAIPNPVAAAPVSLRLSAAADARTQHHHRVLATKQWLHDGVIYQANLAHRLSVAAVQEATAKTFFAERTTAPPACAAWIDLGDDGALVSLSPERFITFDLQQRTIATHPIKGTRPRGDDDGHDHNLRKELHDHDKDRAEHVMIVDLLRNDLSRVCRPGTVTVSSLMHPLPTAHVHHMESSIIGELNDGTSLGAVLAATTPGGSITGAPKSTAIEAIAAFEEGPRGPYTGVLGVIDARGVGVCSLLIRTWLWRHEQPGELWVGGGIVVDSDAEDEWLETLAKARAFGVVA